MFFEIKSKYIEISNMKAMTLIVDLVVKKLNVGNCDIVLEITLLLRKRTCLKFCFTLMIISYANTSIHKLPSVKFTFFRVISCQVSTKIFYFENSGLFFSS